MDVCMILFAKQLLRPFDEVAAINKKQKVRQRPRFLLN